MNFGVVKTGSNGGVSFLCIGEDNIIVAESESPIETGLQMKEFFRRKKSFNPTRFGFPSECFILVCDKKESFYCEPLTSQERAGFWAGLDVIGE